MADQTSITPAQCRGARAMVGMNQEALAAASSVSRLVILDFERERRTPIPKNLAAIRSALEDAGIKFVFEGDGGPGVRPRSAPALHGVDDLHLLWDREKAGYVIKTGVRKTNTGLICHGPDGKECGRVTVAEGLLLSTPSVPRQYSDRMTPAELGHWLSLALRTRS